MPGTPPPGPAVRVLMLSALLCAAGCGAPRTTHAAAPTGTFTALRALDDAPQDAGAAAPADDADEDVVGPVRPANGALDLTPAPTPQRPTFSSNTQTTAAGTFETEVGFVNKETRGEAWPVTLKYGLDEQREVYASVAPVVWRRRRAGTARGPSDLTVGIRQRHGDDDGPVGPLNLVPATLFAVSLPTGDDDVRGGHEEVNFYAAGILDGSEKAFDWTMYYELQVLGEDGTWDFTTQHLAAFAVSSVLDETIQLAGFAELAYLAETSSEDTTYLQAGVTFPTSASTAWDIALRDGIEGKDSDREFHVGFTHNFGRRRAADG